MRVIHHPSATAYLEAAGAFLTAHEDTLNMAYAVAADVARRQVVGAFLASVHDDDDAVVGVAVWTPPFPMIVSALPSAAVSLLVDALDFEGRRALPAVSGPVAASRAVAEAWCARHGGTATPRTGLRAHVLERVTESPRTRGTMRVVTIEEIAFFARWIEAFARELALPAHEPGEVLARRWIEQQALFAWDARDPAQTASMGVVAGKSPNGRRIGWVYTPPEARRKGHAEALVAELSQRVVEEGLRCYLHTDLANPTSNALYARIGYRPTVDVQEMAIAK